MITRIRSRILKPQLACEWRSHVMRIYTESHSVASLPRNVVPRWQASSVLWRCSWRGEHQSGQAVQLIPTFRHVSESASFRAASTPSKSSIPCLSVYRVFVFTQVHKTLKIPPPPPPVDNDSAGCALCAIRDHLINFLRERSQYIGFRCNKIYLLRCE